MTEHTDYELFEQSQNRRYLRRAELIFQFTEMIAGALERDGVKRSELAKRLGKTKGFVSQILAGGRNLTLNTIADVADALGYGIRVRFFRRASERQCAPVRSFMKIPGGKLSPDFRASGRPRIQSTGQSSTAETLVSPFGAAA